MTPEARYQALYEESNGWGDPFSYARSREIHMAGILGHRIADDYSGADAFDDDGGCEYKSTLQILSMQRIMVSVFKTLGKNKNVI